MSSEEEGIDVADLLAPLSREALEMLVLRMLTHNPAEIEFVITECQKPVNTTTLESICKAMTLRDMVGHLDEFIDQTQSYLTLKDTANAMKLLHIITPAAIGLLTDAKQEVALEDPQVKQGVDSFIALMEDLWQEVFKSSENLSRDDAADLFITVSGWRSKLEKKFGPLFSDPLRVLKTRIKKTGASDSSSSSSTKKSKKV